MKATDLGHRTLEEMDIYIKLSKDKTKLGLRCLIQGGYFKDVKPLVQYIRRLDRKRVYR